MILASYQPLLPDSTYNSDLYDCFRDRLQGAYPTFCFPARTVDEFLFRSLLAAPVKPERLLFFNTDEYVRFDAVQWNRILSKDRDSIEFKTSFDRMFDTTVDERFSEYAIDSRRQTPFDIIEIAETIDNISNNAPSGDSPSDQFVREILLLDQERAQRTVLNGLSSTDMTNANFNQDLKAIIQETAFVIYLGAVVYNSVMQNRNTIIDLIPFNWASSNSTSVDCWNKFNTLRDKIYDSKGHGTHKDYLDMASYIESSVGLARKEFLSHFFKRNDLCPCMSGKKFKNCHGKQPVNIFPETAWNRTR